MKGWDKRAYRFTEQVNGYIIRPTRIETRRRRIIIVPWEERLPLRDGYEEARLPSHEGRGRLVLGTQRMHRVEQVSAIVCGKEA